MVWVPGVLAVLLALAGCQVLFTTSPLSFLQRDPSKLPPEQKISYAQDALAGGDTGAMARAFDAIQAEAAAPGADPELTYLAAQLAMELSGAPDLAYQVLDGTIELGDQTAAEAALDTFLASVDGEYINGAADLFAGLQAGSDLEVLSPTDLLLGAGCLLFQAADVNGDVSSLTSADVAPAKAFAAAGLGELTARGISAGDLAYDLLDQLDTFLGGIL